MKRAERSKVPELIPQEGNGDQRSSFIVLFKRETANEISSHSQHCVFSTELYNLLLKMGLIYKVNWAALEARVGQL